MSGKVRRLASRVLVPSARCGLRSILDLTLDPTCLSRAPPKTDACSAQWKDVRIALRAKATSDPDEARRMLAETHYKRNLGSDQERSPTAGVIWDLKEVPGWYDEVQEE